MSEARPLGRASHRSALTRAVRARMPALRSGILAGRWLPLIIISGWVCSVRRFDGGAALARGSAQTSKRDAMVAARRVRDADLNRAVSSIVRFVGRLIAENVLSAHVVHDLVGNLR